MSMIQCPECNSKVSDKARACPNCGINVFWNTAPENGTRVWQMFLGWGIAIALAHICYRFEVLNKELAAVSALGVIMFMNFVVFPAINKFFSSTHERADASERADVFDN